jgi:hypothetical protein
VVAAAELAICSSETSVHTIYTAPRLRRRHSSLKGYLVISRRATSGLSLGFYGLQFVNKLSQKEFFILA